MNEVREKIEQESAESAEQDKEALTLPITLISGPFAKKTRMTSQSTSRQQTRFSSALSADSCSILSSEFGLRLGRAG